MGEILQPYHVWGMINVYMQMLEMAKEKNGGARMLSSGKNTDIVGHFRNLVE